MMATVMLRWTIVVGCVGFRCRDVSVGFFIFYNVWRWGGVVVMVGRWKRFRSRCGKWGIDSERYWQR